MKSSEVWWMPTQTETEAWPVPHNSWLIALVCSAMIGMSGLLPILVLPSHDGRTSSCQQQTLSGGRIMRIMLSFGAGGLLGDVFLHLLPEAYSLGLDRSGGDQRAGHLFVGLCVLGGLLTFIMVEMMFSEDNQQQQQQQQQSGVRVAGYLNLVANCIDNFSHGLAVGGAFLVSNKTGIITTGCILMHEIPHEVGDFAILMKSGFSRSDAATAQLSTAGLGMLGAMFALSLDSLFSIQNCAQWIIPFTAGGFLNIALVTVMPDLMREATTPFDSACSILSIVIGAMVMKAVSNL